MALEIYLHIETERLSEDQKQMIVHKISSLDSFLAKESGNEFWMRASAPETSPPYDARIFIEGENSLLFEVTKPSKELYKDIDNLIQFINSSFKIKVCDEDGEKFSFV